MTDYQPPTEADPYPAPPNTAEDPTPPAVNRRRYIVAAAVFAITALIVVVVGLRFADNSTTATDSEPGTPARQAHYIRNSTTACRAEVASLVDLETGYGTEALIEILGTQSGEINLIEQLYITYQSDTASYGRANAASQLRPAINSTCNLNGNPLLTRGQLDELEGMIGPSPDTRALRQIRIFAH